MKIKSLLAAVSMVALSATAANAIVVTQTNGTLTTPLALELDLAATEVGGTVNVVIAPDSGFFNQGIQHTVIVDLPPGLTFNGQVQGGQLVGSGGELGNVFTGGADNSNTVTFQIAPVTNMTGTFTASLAVQATGDYCAAGAGNGINVIVTTPGGAVNNDVDGDNTNTAVPAGSEIGAASPATPLGGCASALDGTVALDAQDSFIALNPSPSYTTLAAGSGALGTPAPQALGTIIYSPSAPVVVGVNAAGTPIVPANISTVVSLISLPGNPATGGLTLTASSGTIAPFPAGQAEVWQHSAAGAQIVAPASPITIYATANATAPLVAIPNIQPTVTSSTVNFSSSASPNFIPNEPGATGDLDALVRQGQTFGEFDWNAGPAIENPTLSIYRVTGLTGPTNFTIQTTNSNTNGLYSGIAMPDATGEEVLVSTTLPVPADTGRYDFGINFETTNTAIDVDRLLIRGGVTSAFNDGANSADFSLQQPTTDADNNGSE